LSKKVLEGSVDVKDVLWHGKNFVFDRRMSVGGDGRSDAKVDLSQAGLCVGKCFHCEVEYDQFTSQCDQCSAHIILCPTCKQQCEQDVKCLPLCRPCASTLAGEKKKKNSNGGGGGGGGGGGKGEEVNNEMLVSESSLRRGNKDKKRRNRGQRKLKVSRRMDQIKEELKFRSLPCEHQDLVTGTRTPPPMVNQINII
jgi:hypothetical protein